MKLYWHVCDSVCGADFKTVHSKGYEHAFEKLYPEVEHMADETVIHIWTDKTATGYSFLLKNWRPA